MASQKEIKGLKLQLTTTVNEKNVLMEKVDCVEIENKKARVIF